MCWHLVTWVPKVDIVAPSKLQRLYERLFTAPKVDR